MIDSMNAEIALGTISNVSEAVQWIGYTYLFVRMRRNPFYYGMPHDVTADDPQLGNKRHQLVTLAAKKLTDAKMVVFDESSGKFTITDLGRIAAKYCAYLSPARPPSLLLTRSCPTPSRQTSGWRALSSSTSSSDPR